jgi:hypothetical protein
MYSSKKKVVVYAISIQQVYFDIFNNQGAYLIKDKCLFNEKMIVLVISI